MRPAERQVIEENMPALSAFMLNQHSVPDLQAHRWQHRLLLIFAGPADAAELQKQKRLLKDADAGLKERDLQVYYLDAESRQVKTLRSKLHSHQDGFEVMLIGKDGGVKQRQPNPVGAQGLFDLIDSMPMRQDERRRQ